MRFTGPLPEHILRLMPQEVRAPMGKAGKTLPEIGAASEVKYERELQKQIANYLRLHNVTAIQSRMDRKTTNAVGTPDFLFAIAGQAIAVEAKRPGGKLRPEQEAMRDGLVRDGWLHVVAYRLEDVQELFKTTEEE